jgi:hypothetical protein
MPTFTIHYRQTEYRTKTITAATVAEAREIWLDSASNEHDDQFAGTGDDQTIIAIDDEHGNPADDIDATVPYIAHFVPQAWIDDNAVEVDASGEQEWLVSAEAWEWIVTPEMIESIKLDYTPGVLAPDELRGDPAAPEWVRAWSGPYDVFVRRA